MKLFLLTILFSCSAYAVELYVAPAGSNANPVAAMAQQKPKLQLAEGAWQFYPAASRHPGRSRVLLIGDSIVNGYRSNVIKALGDTVDVDVWLTPLHENSPQLHSDLQAVLRQGPYDVIHFNIGLHGWEAGSIPEGRYVPLMKEYISILRKEAPQAKLIWASSTPVTEPGKPELNRQINPTIAERNSLAAEVMLKNGIAVDDLYSLIVGKLDLSAGDRFHWKPESYKILSEAVATQIRAKLPSR